MALGAIFDSPSDPYTYVIESVGLSGIPLAGIDVTAQEYLQYAAEDLSADTQQGFINGIGNAKRAIHLVVDSLLNAYGLWTKNRKASFPEKLRLLDAAGFFTLSILHTLNLERNVIEHEYRIPTKARVQEMIDVGRLLLLATQRMTEFVPYESLVGWRDGDIHGVVQVNPNAGLLSFFSVTGAALTTEDNDGCEITMLSCIRTFEGELLPGIQVEPKAIWEHELRIGNLAEWLPLLKPIVELNDLRQAPQQAKVYNKRISLSMRVSLPYSAEAAEAIEKVVGPIVRWSDFNFGFNPELGVDQ
jgi:hypothetical protein